jgi:hypothetical protein
VQSPTTPLNALVAGPMVGGPWGPGDPAPRAVSVDYWEQVCPPADRHILYSDAAKGPVRTVPGDVLFAHMLNLVKSAPARCVEFVPTPGSNDVWPQTFDLFLVSTPRFLPLGAHLLNSSASTLLAASPLVRSAVVRNEPLFAPRGPRAPARVGPFAGAMAIHLRRGDYEKHCPHLARLGAQYYQWCVRAAPRRAVPRGPPGLMRLRVSGTCGRRGRTSSPSRATRAAATRATLRTSSTGSTGARACRTPARAAHRARRLRGSYPTDAELLATIRRARADYTAAVPGTPLDVLYVMTEAADGEWWAAFRAALAADGWATIVTTAELELDDEQTEVGMAVDMEIARLADVFVGNGVRRARAVLCAGRRGADGPGRSGRRSRATSTTAGSSTAGRRSGAASGSGARCIAPGGRAGLACSQGGGCVCVNIYCCHRVVICASSSCVARDGLVRARCAGEDCR